MSDEQSYLGADDGREPEPPQEGFEDFLRSMRGKAQSWIDGAKDVTDAVPHDYFDEMTYGETRDAAPDFRKQEREYAKEYDYTEALWADMFYLLSKGDPQIRQRGEMREEFIPNREIIEQLSKLQECKDLRDFTRGDPMGTAMGILSMDTEIGEALAKMKAAQELAKKLQELRDQLLEAAKKAQDEDDPSELAELMAQAMETEDAANGVEVQLDAEAADAVAAASQQLRQGLQKAAEDAAEEQGLAQMFGTEPGVLQRMEFKERRALALQMRGSRMAQFVKLFGAMQMLSWAAKRKRVDHVPSEIAGLETTDDLARLAPFEYLNLASPELENDFWLRYVNHQLATWRLHGTERQGKGPVIVVCDESGSMSMADIGGNTREAWSKAFLLALADQARREEREVYYIGFASYREQYEADLTKGGFAAVFEVCEHFFAGGTYYDKPLRQAMDLALERHAANGLDRPDIVFITDDEYSTLDEAFVTAWKQDAAKLSMHVYGVGIGTQGAGAMAQVCDTVTLMGDLVTGNNVAADLFRQL